MSITIDNIKTWKDWGMVLTPAKDKKPLTKEGEWSAKWSDEELLKAERLAVFHQPEKRGVKGSNIMTIDFDCPKFIASAFSSLFPVSFSMGKEDSSGSIRTTHIEYEINPADKPRGKAVPKYEGVIEVLTSTCSIIAGKDRHLINNIKPLRLSKTQLGHVLITVKVVNFLREAFLLFPEKGLQKRDNFHLRLAGSLLDTDLTSERKEEIIEAFCYATNDLREIENRKRKIKYVEKNPESAFRIKGLCEYAGVDHTSPLAKAFDELKPEIEVDEKEKPETPQGLTTLTLNQFVAKTYPPITYYMYPIISNECLGMIFALPGKGKTLFALELAWRCSQGLDFMDWKFNNMIKPPPVLYVEGEMSATQVQDRVSSMVERDRGLKDFDLDNFYIAVLKEQPNESYQKLKTPEGRLNVQNSADEIYKKTGKKPIIFLDNVRFLMGNFNEKEGQDWIDFVLWLATLRAKGYSTYFLHHAVNTGEKASGSGYQDSNLDVNIKLSQPDENSATDHSSDHFTQIQFEFKKMRENVIGQMTPFIMVVDRNKGSWSKFPVLNKTERKIKSMLDSGKSAKDIINPEKEGMSKANVHKTINKLKGENDGVDKKTSNREAKEVC